MAPAPVAADGSARASDAGALPHAMTFFLTKEERRAVVKELRRFDGDRERALLKALRVRALAGKGEK